MALQISGTTVVDNTRNLTSIESFLSSVKSIWANTIVNSLVGSLVTPRVNSLSNRWIAISTGNYQQNVLPSSPTIGMEVVVGGVGNGVNYIIVDPGATQSIMGLPSGETLIIDVPNTIIRLIYVGNTVGWSIN